MVTEFHNIESDRPMTYLEELLKHSGGSIASFGGSLAVCLTFIGDLSQWVAIVGGAVALVGGCLGIVSKVQEIRFKNLQYTEFQKSIERDAKMFEDVHKAAERDALKKEVLKELKA